MGGGHSPMAQSYGTVLCTVLCTHKGLGYERLLNPAQRALPCPLSPVCIPVLYGAGRVLRGSWPCPTPLSPVPCPLSRDV